MTPAGYGTTVTGHLPAFTSRTAREPMNRCPALADAPTTMASARVGIAHSGMISPVNQQTLASYEQADLLVRRFRPDWRVARIWPLAGAVSSQVSGIEAEGPDGQRHTLVLRQYGAANLQSDPHSADTEYRLLQLLSAAGLPVPRPCLVDESGAIVPGPCLLEEFIDGERVDDPPDLASFTRQLAAELAALHDAGFARADVPFLADVGDHVSHQLGTGPHTLDDVVMETAIRRTLQANWPPPQVSKPVVLHGDYWPGNVLWRDGRLVGVIDWEDAAFGDPLADLAIARLEIVWFFGTAAMDMLTDAYLALRPAVGAATLPVWDLRAAMRACEFPFGTWELPPDQIASVRAAHREFAQRAISQL
jgi:aminoglycoside phosphotransferase (APT) family kinase protein